MKVKEIIKLVAEMIGEEEVVKLCNDLPPNDKEYASASYNLLLRCYHLIVEELACEYYPVKNRQVFEDVKDNKIFFSAFEYQPLRILNTFDKYGQKLGYRLINDYILVNEKNACVEYEYRISKEGEEDESFYASKIIGPYVIAYGVASQYLTEKGRYSDADIFQSRYLQGIKSRLAKKGSLKMPKRRWE